MFFKIYYHELLHPQQAYMNDSVSVIHFNLLFWILGISGFLLRSGSHSLFLSLTLTSFFTHILAPQMEMN